jgi:hypothetical protein
MAAAKSGERRGGSSGGVSSANQSGGINVCRSRRAHHRVLPLRVSAFNANKAAAPRAAARALHMAAAGENKEEKESESVMKA